MTAWEELIARKDEFIGGDIEEQDGGVRRGRIKDLTVDGDMLVISCDWVADLDFEGDTPWKKDDDSDCSFRVNMQYIGIQDIGNGRMMYALSMCGPVVLFPKGFESNLDPSKVRGLIAA